MSRASLDTSQIRDYTWLDCLGARVTEVNLMAGNCVFRSVLLAAGVLLIAACASQPTSSPAAASVPTPLLEMKFQRAARHYDRKYQYQGQLVYCKRGATRSLPPTECITEAALRLQVENFHKSRNVVARGGPQYVATVPGGSGQ
jgi:hypothetical protein